MNYFGQIDLTKLGIIVRQHPELVKEINFKDGTHKLINIEVVERHQPSEKGHTHFVKVPCKKDQQKEWVNYFVSDLKPSQYSNSTQSQTAQGGTQASDDGLPF